MTEAHEYYKDPEHLRPAGPWVAAWIRPGMRNLRYAPEQCGPQSQTVNTGSLPYWKRNPAARQSP
jgi:hypothetical protein